MSPTSSRLFQSYQSKCLLKRGHCNDIESSSAAVKRIRIVPDKNHVDETTFMCEVCSQILMSLENHMDEDNTYEEKIRKFQQSFEAVHTRFNLSETPMVHVFYSHVKDYISKCGHTMAMFSDEPIETSHGRLRFMERRHNFRCRSLVRKYKSQRSKSSFDMWNMKNLNLIKKKKKKKRDIGGGYW